MPAFARNSSQTTLLLAMHPLSCASELINLLYGTNPDLRKYYQSNLSKTRYPPVSIYRAPWGHSNYTRAYEYL
ncbi:hypothetical protein CI102_12638 [Trichoderma harzianum]|uniref:Uncharacterized protein n=1 Tax=Trichoderma harzianum CBS 226.95 TaxID=983964 RepID=A0A2T4AP82_TRIHA|nr:hypothetical protein M431DRAFT_287599 [Trichoderma harzianum CBS 226.95]PKK44044.1 hypothetical protein CI102_12638 [Trichoderma harzianum]PTB58830.1 hypothetical protein M431DRAFT_287599 [Trichoderma harzianum CBS 226.95]